MSFTKRTYTAHETIITAENLNDIQDAIIAGEFLSGTGEPTSATVGAVNQLYRDESTGKEYVCIAVNDGVYTWEELNRKPNNYGYEGVDLSQKFTAAQLHAKVAAGDFSGINIGDYFPITLNGTYHDAASDSDKTMNETVIMEVAGINTYLRSGDTELTKQHLVMVSRDCLANTIQMRSENSTWYDDTANTPWLGSAAFATLNDADNGIIKLVEETPLGAYIHDMRYYAEKMAAGAGSPSGGEWKNRGKLFLLTESEVYGQGVHQNNGSAKYMLWNQLPIFAGSNRHIIKGSGNGGGRCYWWLALATSATYFCDVYSSGFADYTSAAAAYRVPLCFLFT